MNVWLQLAIGIVALYFVLRFIRGRLSSREPSGSVEGPLIGGPLDPSAGMRSPKKTRAEESIRRDSIGGARGGGRGSQLSSSQFIRFCLSLDGGILYIPAK
jgi:hypothetical protein